MYVKLTNGTVDTYPYNVGQLRRDNPNTSFPKKIPDDMLESYGIHVVHPVPQPSHTDRTQWLRQNDMPHMEAGKWFIGWSVVDKTAEEVQQYDANVAASNRSTRDALLASSDWTQVADAPVDATAWATYRQALRDITAHANWPHLTEADWPVKP